jgi:hypothetical protein
MRSWDWNWILSTVNLGYASSNGIVILAEGLDVSIAAGWNPSVSLSFPKRTLVGLMSGSLTHMDGIALAESLRNLGTGNRVSQRPPWLGETGHVCFWIISWHLPYTENHSQSRRLVLDNSRCVDLTAPVGAGSTGVLTPVLFVGPGMT